MDEILAALKKLFPILLMVLLMAPSALFSKKRKEAREKSRKPGSPPPVGDSDLARRVQKNFEKLMKQRTGEAPAAEASAEPEPWKPIATIPGPRLEPRASARKPEPARTAAPSRKPKPRQVPRKTRHSPPTGPAAPADPEHGKAYEIGRDAYQVENRAESEARVAYQLDQASTTRPIKSHRARQILLGGGPMGRDQLRRAVLLKEILDRPVGERSTRDFIPGA